MCKRGHHPLCPLPIVIFHYLYPKVGCTIAKLLCNYLLELFSGSNFSLLECVFIVLLRLDHLFAIRYKFYLRGFFIFSSIVIQANTRDNLTQFLPVDPFLPTFTKVILWWVEEIKIGLLAFFLSLRCLPYLLYQRIFQLTERVHIMKNRVRELFLKCCRL